MYQQAQREISIKFLTDEVNPGPSAFALVTNGCLYFCRNSNALLNRRAPNSSSSVTTPYKAIN